MTTRQKAAWAMTIGLTLGAGAQTNSSAIKDDLFAGTEKFSQGASSVTQIDMDPEELGRVDGKDKLKARKTVLSVVHTYEYDKPGLYRVEDVDAFRKKLETGDWHCSVHIRETKSGQSTDVCNKRRDDGMREEAVITVEPRSLTFIHTIRKVGGPGGESNAIMPLNLRMMRPEVDVERAVARAEMQAQMAMMRPGFEKLKSFPGPNAEQRKHLQEGLEGLDGLEVYPDVRVNSKIN